MQVTESSYFSYVIPAVICFITGLHVFSKKLDGEVLNVEKIEKFIKFNSALPYYFIIIGFISTLVADFFTSSFTFIFYLFGVLKFIGVLMLIFTNHKQRFIAIFIVYTYVIVASLASAMFHDLLIWLIFLGAFLAIKYKPKEYIKLLITIVFIALIIFIQIGKSSYRRAISADTQISGLNTFANSYVNSQNNSEIIDINTLANNNVRINQGYIVSNIMKTVPSKIPFSEGSELFQIIEAAILPRFISANKLRAGDREIFTKFSGLELNTGTSMGLSSVGDAYINFGITGGCIMMFFLGLLYNQVLKAFHKYSKYYPILLLFTPLVFYYPIRPDCELQTILGHLVKSCFLIFVIMQVWKKLFRVHPASNHEQQTKRSLAPAS